MAKLKYEKFQSERELGVNILGGLRRLENNGTCEIIFRIDGYDLSGLRAGYVDIDFDKKSDEILFKIPKESNAYFIWAGQDFSSCEKKEIIK